MIKSAPQELCKTINGTIDGNTVVAINGTRYLVVMGNIIKIPKIFDDKDKR